VKITAFRKAGFFFLLLSIHSSINAQDSIPIQDKVIQFPNQFLQDVTSKAKRLEDKVMDYSEKALAKLEKQELKLKRKLAKKDSLAAVQIFGDVKGKYKSLRSQLTKTESKLSGLKEYLPGLDTLKTSLSFLSENPTQFLKDSKQFGDLACALKGLNGIESKLQGAESIRSYLKERRQQLKEQLDGFGLTKQLAKYNKEAYYYSQQINEYKAILQDPRKREQKALELITKSPAFQKFFSQHSELAQLFPMPYGNGTAQSLAGLQTRAGVQGLMQQQLSAGGANASQVLQQGIGQAQAQLNQLKDKINKLGGGSGDLEIPEFKNPNSQKVKSFWKRMELGTDFQNTRGSSFLPITSDFGVSLGYKLNDKSVLGIGGSYKMGWGKDIRNISISHEGISIRSFLDWKLKGNFFISGGYEQNYRTRFYDIQQLRTTPQNWLQSGLVGLKKKYSISKKIKGNFQLLFDFLYQTHIPQTQPILFRLGYTL
jgi:hypothetical protein